MDGFQEFTGINLAHNFAAHQRGNLEIAKEN